MKRLFLTVVLAAAGWCAYAQNYMIVDSEKIFKSIDAYNTAIKDLDKMAEDYQKQVDDKFAEIETLYNNYQQQKASLSATTRQVLEDTILSKEKDATALQESLFGKDEETSGTDPADPEKGLRRHQRLRPEPRLRSGARFGIEPHAAVQRPETRPDGRGHQKSEITSKINHI